MGGVLCLKSHSLDILIILSLPSNKVFFFFFSKKFLQQLMGGVIAVVLRPRESQCPLVRCFARELLTCLVMQPVMNLACPL